MRRPTDRHVHAVGGDGLAGMHLQLDLRLGRSHAQLALPHRPAAHAEGCGAWAQRQACACSALQVEGLEDEGGIEG
eukprot:365233-Chlamydomonas_euryale.AAC.6